MVKCEANHLYLVHIKLAQPMCFMILGWGDEVAWHWHERFGHVNIVALQKLAQELLVRGPPEIGQVELSCEACQAGKQQCTSFSVKVEYQASRCLDLVHDDLCGPIAQRHRGVTSTSCCSWTTSAGTCG
jgi:hypothetical protein